MLIRGYEEMEQVQNTQINHDELSYFDVKEQYDLAYANKDTDETQFKILMAKALEMDIVYRHQLEQEITLRNERKQQRNIANNNNIQAA